MTGPDPQPPPDVETVTAARCVSCGTLYPLPAGPAGLCPQCAASERIRAAASAWRGRLEESDTARDAVVAAVRAAPAAGISESEAARLAGVTRVTVRAWLGKRQPGK